MRLRPFQLDEDLFARQTQHQYIEELVLNKLDEQLTESSMSEDSIEGCRDIAHAIIDMWRDGMGRLDDYERMPQRDTRRKDSIFMQIFMDVTMEFMRKQCRNEIQESRQPMFTDAQLKHHLLNYDSKTGPMFDQSTWIQIWLQINVRLEKAKRSPQCKAENNFLTACQTFARMAIGQLASLTSTFCLERKGF